MGETGGRSLLVPVHAVVSTTDAAQAKELLRSAAGPGFWVPISPFRRIAAASRSLSLTMLYCSNTLRVL